VKAGGAYGAPIGRREADGLVVQHAELVKRIAYHQFRDLCRHPHPRRDAGCAAQARLGAALGASQGARGGGRAA
jgi:hypothetical protein